MSVCANCGKGEEASINLKACTACKMVKYCNRDCQIAHRPQHKKACKKKAKELYDEKLFEQPPPDEDCPICFQRLPSLASGRTYMPCCGKIICSGCICAYQLRVVLAGKKEKEQKCPFCRTPAPATDKEWVQRMEKRMDMNDAEALHDMGFGFRRGEFGLPQNHAKALELWHRSAELGSSMSYCKLGNAHYNGEGVERDEQKANHYWELAAMRGHVESRHNLGNIEARVGNMDRAIKHWTIAARGGESASLRMIKQLYEKGFATKDDYAKALSSYQTYVDEIKSDQRDEAAAYSAAAALSDATFREDFKYY